MKNNFLIFLLLMLLLQPLVTAQEQCQIELMDKDKGIHIVVNDCYNIGTFSIGGLYDSRWEKLTYHYPKPWEGTFLSIKVNNKVYSNSNDSKQSVNMDSYIEELPHVQDSKLITTWRLPDNVLVKEIFQLTEQGTNIQIDLINQNSEPISAGARLHIDTMLGENDGAPIYIPGEALKSREKEYSGNELNFDYWKAYNREEDPSVISTGNLSGPDLTYPDKFTVAYWKKSMLSSWDYQIDPERTILGDSAVILYYDPQKIDSGETRTIRTSYINGEPVLPPAKGEFGIADTLFTDKSGGRYCPGDTSQISVDVLSRNSPHKGTILFQILDSEGRVVYTKSRETGAVEPDIGKTLDFEWKTPQNISRTFKVRVQLSDENGIIDQKSLSLEVDPEVCPKPLTIDIDFGWLIYLMPFLLLAGIVVLFAVVLKRIEWGSVELIKEKEGENVKITAINRKNKPLEDCVIEDTIPEGAEVDVSTIGVKRKETQLWFDVGTLEAGEQAILEYTIKGYEVLPPARITWSSGEKILESESIEKIEKSTAKE